MNLLKRTTFSLPFLFLATFAAAVLISGGDYSMSLGGFTSLFSPSAPSGGDFSVQSSAGGSLGAVKISGGDFTVASGANPAGAGLTTYLKQDLNEVIVFPNPYRPGSGTAYDASAITFRNLTTRSTIRIFNIAGELVRSIENDGSSGEVKWDAKNDAGEKVASGVYIYYIFNTDNPGQKTKGKLAIIK